MRIMLINMYYEVNAVIYNVSQLKYNENNPTTIIKVKL